MLPAYMIRKCVLGMIGFLTAGYFSFAQVPLTAVWDNGLKFRSQDGATSINIGGRLNYDVAFIKHSRELDSIAGPAQDKLEVRRARISFEGTIKSALKYEFEFTFGERIRFADLYVAFLKIPGIEQLTIGHFREPFGMEENTSSNSIVFMERSLTSAFSPGRNAGLMAQRTFLNNRMRAYAGVFRITNSLGSDLEAENKHSYSSRVAYLPLSDSAKNQALHFGLSANIYSPPKSNYQLNVENETHTGGTYIKSGEIQNVSNIRNFGSEFGYSVNRLTVQSEYMHSFVRIKDLSSTDLTDKVRDFNSFYAMASYFLGGGKRRYQQRGNRFSSISVADGSKNAWELGVRYSHIFLKESVEEIKKMSDYTIGVNWYYSENMRFMFNYVHSRIQNRYSANAFQTRLQLSF